MIDLLITLVVVLIVLGLAYWAVHRLEAAFGIPGPIVAIVDVVLVIIFVLVLLSVLLPGRVPSLR